MTIFIETERLIINIPTLSDLQDQHLLQSDPDVMQYIGLGPRTENEVLEGLLNAIRHQEKHGFSLGSVFEKDTGDFVGRAGLIYLAFDDTQADIEVGYALLKKYWAKGYATELANACIAWGFKHLTVEKLVAVTRPKNEKSSRVLEKAGMHFVKRTLYNNIEVVYYEIAKSRYVEKLS
jgi:ribosomal-protein-alanine N-acetyltransferase